MDDWNERADRAAATSVAADNEFDRQCNIVGTDPDRPDEALAAIAEFEARRRNYPPSGLLAPVKSWYGR
jgi:hypothetical protein